MGKATKNIHAEYQKRGKKRLSLQVRTAISS
jgi:hypothetical protein